MANEKPIDVSIHPRVVKSSQNQIGRRLHEKVNTSKKADPNKLRSKIDRMNDHMGRHPRDGATSGHISKLNTKLGAI